MRRSCCGSPSPARIKPEAAVVGQLEVDAAVIGGGFTGVATAIALGRPDPSLEVAMLGAKAVGYECPFVNRHVIPWHLEPLASIGAHASAATCGAEDAFYEDVLARIKGS